MAKRILLVEDDPFLSSLLKNRLTKEGFDVQLAKTGDEGLTAIKANSFDLVLLDLILPGKTGFELMEEVNKDPNIKKSPILIISNLGQESDIEKGKSLGAVDYYIKANTSVSVLVDKVKDFLKR